MKDWSWRVEEPGDSARLGLRYEPGNWGDVLKGVWLVELAAALSTRAGRTLRYGDPFAGAPTWPAVGRAAERIAAAPGGFASLQAPYLAAGLVASTGRIAHDAAARGLESLVFEADEVRRDAWRSVPGCRVAGVDDGWRLLEADELADRDLVLVDPFDLDRTDRYRPALPHLARLSEAGVPLLLYLFNRSPRGPGNLREYRRLRERLGEALGREPDAVGRVPTDGLLPRAWHEVLLVSARGAAVPIEAAQVETLRQATETLAWRILRPGCFEGP